MGRAPGNGTLRVKADCRGNLNRGLQQHLELSFCKPEGINSNTLHFLWQSFIVACELVYWKTFLLRKQEIAIMVFSGNVAQLSLNDNTHQKLSV